MSQSRRLMYNHFGLLKSSYYDNMLEFLPVKGFSIFNLILIIMKGSPLFQEAICLSGACNTRFSHKFVLPLLSVTPRAKTVSSKLCPGLFPRHLLPLLPGLSVNPSLSGSSQSTIHHSQSNPLIGNFILNLERKTLS